MSAEARKLRPEPSTGSFDDGADDRRESHLPCRISIPFTLIACENAEAELLMLKRRKPPFVGRWNFIGGKIDDGELPHDSAVREIAEEVGQSVSPTSLKYRGVAAWPRTCGDEAELEGMHLFHARLTKKANSNRQLGILDEGTTAWLPLHLLRQDGYYAPVPNFHLLSSLILGRVATAPLTLFHWLGEGGAYKAFYAPIRREFRAPSRFAPGKAEVPVSELADIEATVLQMMLDHTHHLGAGEGG